VNSPSVEVVSVAVIVNDDVAALAWEVNVTVWVPAVNGNVVDEAGKLSNVRAKSPSGAVVTVTVYVNA